MSRVDLIIIASLRVVFASIWVAGVAGFTLVDITVYAVVFIVHIGLIVFVAVDAAEDAEIVGDDMTGAAVVVPFALVFTGKDREVELIVLIEAGIVPVVDVVAKGTVGGEAGSRVLVFIVLSVAGVAVVLAGGGWLEGKVVGWEQVAGFASDSIVGSEEGESAGDRGVVELHAGPDQHRVAIFAGFGKTAGDVVDAFGSEVVFLMAIDAFGAAIDGEVAVGLISVAGLAGDLAVCPDEGEVSTLMNLIGIDVGESGLIVAVGTAFGEGPLMDINVAGFATFACDHWFTELQVEMTGFAGGFEVGTDEWEGGLSVVVEVERFFGRNPAIRSMT